MEWTALIAHRNIASLILPLTLKVSLTVRTFHRDSSGYRAELSEVLYGPRTDLVEELHPESSRGHASDGHVEEDHGVTSRQSLAKKRVHRVGLYVDISWLPLNN